jgi:hypothetical protein
MTGAKAFSPLLAQIKNPIFANLTPNRPKVKQIIEPASPFHGDSVLKPQSLVYQAEVFLRFTGAVSRSKGSNKREPNALATFGAGLSLLGRPDMRLACFAFSPASGTSLWACLHRTAA